MSNFDDWGAENKDWGSSKGNSDFDFNWDPEGNFQHTSEPRKSLITTISSQPIWLKIVSVAAVFGLFVFVFVQAGGITQLRSKGLFRESVTPIVACLNSAQVGAELGLGIANQATMDRILSHATLLKSQQSGDPDIDAAMWSVADAAFLTQGALDAWEGNLDFGDLLAGDYEQSINSPEVLVAASAIEESTNELASACDSLNSLEPSEADSNVSEPQGESALPDEQIDTPSTQESVPSVSSTGEANISKIQSATLRVDCRSDGVMGSGFFIDLTSLTVSPEGGRVILTNHHVIEGCINEGSVTISQGESEASAEIVSFDPVFDLAILESEAFPEATVLTPSFSYGVGEEVVTSGHPDGIKTAITFGRITLFDEEEYLIYSDALAGPGSSGGPMLNANGEAIGVVTFILEEVRGMSLASPIDAVCIELLACVR